MLLRQISWSLLSAFLLWGLTAGEAMARKYGMAGCGLGSMVIKPSGSQTSAATTNGTSGNQTFGITFGTSNCNSASEMAALNDQQMFVTTNLHSLSKEAARGHGNTLQAFSATFGCSIDARPEFNDAMRTHFQEVFRAPGAIAVLEKSRSLLLENKNLAKQCQYLAI